MGIIFFPLGPWATEARKLTDVAPVSKGGMLLSVIRCNVKHFPSRSIAQIVLSIRSEFIRSFSPRPLLHLSSGGEFLARSFYRSWTLFTWATIEEDILKDFLDLCKELWIDGLCENEAEDSAESWNGTEDAMKRVHDGSPLAPPKETCPPWGAFGRYTPQMPSLIGLGLPSKLFISVFIKSFKPIAKYSFTAFFLNSLKCH